VYVKIWNIIDFTKTFASRNKMRVSGQNNIDMYIHIFKKDYILEFTLRIGNLLMRKIIDMDYN